MLNYEFPRINGQKVRRIGDLGLQYFWKKNANGLARIFPVWFVTIIISDDVDGWRDSIQAH